MTELTPFTIPVNGAQIAGTLAGNGSAVVFLHAGVADKRMWADQQEALSDTFHTTAYDRRGFGETTTADVPFVNVEDLRAVLDELEIETAVLVGCSQGGLVAINFALAYPQRVAALVLIASAISGAPAPDSLPPEIEARMDALDAAEEAGDLTRVNELEAVLWLDGPASPEGRVGGAVRDLFLDMNGIALAHSELTQEINAPAAYDRLAELEMPVLVLWGDLDFAHIRQRGQVLVETIPEARGVEIPGTAHLPNLEQPQRVNALLREFLASLTL